jgi:CO/xanthine dehydrogenase FAD-binding subunit
VAQAPLTGLAPIADVRGSAEYRLDAVRELVSRALITAAEAADER